MADNELTLHIKTVFDGAEKLSKQIADSVPNSGMNKKRVAATSQKLAGTDAQLSQLESIWQQMDPQEALASLRKILVSYEKINFGMAKYSAEAQKEIQDLTDQIESKQEELDNLARKDKINRGKLGSVRYNRDENDNVIGAKSLTLGSTEIKAGLPDVLKGTDLDVDKGTRAALLNAQKDDSLTDEQKKAAEAYAKDVQAEEATLLKQLNDEIQLREKLRQEIASLEVQKAKKVENATTPSDTFSEDNALNTGTAEKLITDTNNVADATKKAAGGEKDLGEETDKTEKTQKKQDNTIAKAVKSFFGYQQVIRALRTVVNFTVKTITDLDKALTDQAIVSGLTRKQTWDLVSSYAAMAKQTGFTTTEIAQTASKFLQQGKTVAETLKLTKAAAESARVAGISASQAVDYLTTALNGFQMSADQSLEVSDKFAAIAASSATSYQELATALSKVASQANLAGMSMDYTLALLAKGIETTRESAESIGTALKTVVARMREITDYGKTLEDGTDVNNVETQLKAVGISLRDNNGELRSTQDVLNEVGLKWSSLSSNQQAALAKALAGTRQQSRLISMMDNYDRTLELLEISQNSLGATEAQQAKYMQSMAAATNNVQVAWQDLITAFTNADAIIDVINLFSDLIETVKDNMVGLSVVMFAMIIPGLVAMKIATTAHTIAVVKDMTAEEAGKTLQKAGLITTLLTIIATKRHTQATWGDTVAQLGLNKALYACPVVWILAIIIAIIAAIALVTVGIIALMKHFGVFESSQEKAIKSMKSLTAEAYNFKKTASDFESVIDAFDKVDEKIIKTKSDIESLNTTADKTRELLNNLNTSDARNSDLLKAIFGTDNKDEIESLIESASPEQLKKYAQLAEDISKKKANEANRKIISTGVNTEGILDTTEGLALTKNAVASVGNDSISEVGKTADMTEEQIANVKLTWQSMVDSMDATDFVGKTEEQVANMGKEFADYMSGINRNTLNAFYDSSADIKDRVAAYNTITKGMSKEMKDNFNAAYPEFKSLMDNYGKAISDGVVSGLGISVESLNTFNKSVKDILKDANETLNGFTTDDLMDSMGKMVEEGASFEDIVSMLTTKFGLSAESAEKIAGSMGVAASNGKTLLDSTEEQSSLTSKASNLRETQGKWASMTDAEKNEYIASHSDFFQQAGAREAFESGADITPYIKGAYGEDQQKLIKQYKAQALSASAEIKSAQEEIDKATASGDEVALKAAREKKTAAEEEYREAVEFQKDALKMFNISLDDIVKKQESQLSTYKNFLKQQQTDLINSLNARKAAYQDYFDTINAAYDEQNFADEEQRIQEQIVKFSTGTDATSQNKVLELTNKLTELQNNHADEQRKNAQQAVLNNIDDEISKVNDYYDKVLNDNSKMLSLMNQWLASGKSRDEYKAYLTKLGYTDAQKQQSLQTFDILYADGKGAGLWMNDPKNTEATTKNTTGIKENTASLDQVTEAMKSFQALQLAQVASSMVDKNGNVATIKNENGGMTVNFAGETYTLGSDKGHTVSDIIMAMLKNAKFATKVG